MKKNVGTNHDEDASDGADEGIQVGVMAERMMVISDLDHMLKERTAENTVTGALESLGIRCARIKVEKRGPYETSSISHPIRQHERQAVIAELQKMIEERHERQTVTAELQKIIKERQLDDASTQEDLETLGLRRAIEMIERRDRERP